MINAGADWQRFFFFFSKTLLGKDLKAKYKLCGWNVNQNRHNSQDTHVHYWKMFRL